MSRLTIVPVHDAYLNAHAMPLPIRVRALPADVQVGVSGSCMAPPINVGGCEQRRGQCRLTLATRWMLQAAFAHCM